MMNINSEIQDSLDKILKSSPVIAGYIFGSRIRGIHSATSDLDMALVIDNPQEIDYTQMYSRLSKLFPDIELDLRIVSSKTNLLFIFQILKNGKCIYSKDEKERIIFETRSMREFYDSEKIRQIYDYYLNKSLKEGNFGHG